jgi:hypothetical protein
MDFYAVQLGKTGSDGFRLIESSNVLASSTDEARQRTVDLLKTRGVLLGANKARLLGANEKLVFEYP